MIPVIGPQDKRRLDYFAGGKPVGFAVKPASIWCTRNLSAAVSGQNRTLSRDKKSENPASGFLEARITHKTFPIA